MPVGTALHDRTFPLGESLSYLEWSGYYAASSYESHHEHEYNAIRNGSALIDVSPLFKYRVSGPDAARLVDRLITRDVSRMTVGQVFYTPWCDEHGLYFKLYGYGGFPVLDDGQLAGLMTVHEIQAVPVALWPWRRVGQVMRPLTPSLVVEPDVPVIQAMERMAREGWDRLVVMQDGQIAGLVTHSAIVHYLQLRRSSDRN